MFPSNESTTSSSCKSVDSDELSDQGYGHDSPVSLDANLSDDDKADCLQNICDGCGKVFHLSALMCGQCLEKLQKKYEQSIR